MKANVVKFLLRLVKPISHAIIGEFIEELPKEDLKQLKIKIDAILGEDELPNGIENIIQQLKESVFSIDKKLDETNDRINDISLSHDMTKSVLFDLTEKRCNVNVK